MRTHFSIAMLLAACTAPSTEVPLDQDFELRQGQTVKLAGTGETVTFESVAEDSRCPADVVCVWAGNARVALRVGAPGQDSSVSVNTGIEPRAIQIGKVRLELKDVTPVPRAGTRIPADMYRVTLRASGA
jgi:hypothetical protein